MKRRSVASRIAPWGLAALGLLAMAATGCSVGYVARAAYEEARILWRRQDIDRKLAEPELPPATKRKLELVLDVRRFAAKRLDLRIGGSFRTVSVVDRRAIVQLLTAAPRDRLEPYTWWFPIVGRVPYRGFFSEHAAAALAADLERQSYDTYVRPAIAFSTLGWFDDPVPTTLLNHDEVTLAQVIFHELWHNTLFLPGETAFDESTATFAGYRAAIEFFCDPERATPDSCRVATADWQDTLTISRFFATSLAALGAFYDTKPTHDVLEEGRRRAFAEIRERFRSLKLHPGRYTDFAAGPINNASLLQERIYLKDLDVFDRLYRGAGSLRRALDEIREAADRGGDPFDRVREAAGRSATPTTTGSDPASRS
ncbi:MAG: aminopeptidase [Candidatus Binatia bacterium]